MNLFLQLSNNKSPPSVQQFHPPVPVPSSCTLQFQFYPVAVRGLRSHSWESSSILLAGEKTL